MKNGKFLTQIVKKQTSYIVDGLIARNRLAIWASPPGEGKSLTAEYIGYYSMIAGVICIAVGSGLLVLNALITRSKEIEGVPTWRILVFFCVVGVIALISSLVVALI